ncbi:unnamed protein product [Darwinula stevensoni]|uniref:Uncharacterized protein n=1 Tax=Darwinula stevensoni TaxID=69355 RepID=A0A7R8XKH7_9CRUS|nr:unnamed protein product [Darwinula stevensoni]CAG0895236.1 unnamed protein product [Darwinula stevensoni]
MVLQMSRDRIISASEVVFGAPARSTCIDDIYTENLTDPAGYIVPCTDEAGQVPRFQRVLWNVFPDVEAESIDFVIEPGTFTFPEDDARVQIGTGNKDEFENGATPQGLEEEFSGPVNQTGSVEMEVVGKASARVEETANMLGESTLMVKETLVRMEEARAMLEEMEFMLEVSTLMVEVASVRVETATLRVEQTAVVVKETAKEDGIETILRIRCF